MSDWLEAIATNKRRGPVQREHFTTLPMGVLELAYEEYAHRFGTSQSLEQLNERGGFGVGEVIGLLADLVERKRGS